MSSKTQSILSYLGILWLVAYFGGKQKRDSLSTYHLRQGLGLLVVAILVNLMLNIIIMLVPTLSTPLSLISVVFLILMIFGIINAANEVRKPLPLIGKLFENQFPFLDSSKD
ncbi:DUF4870 domain-containing protein [Sphingobacterium corticibacterium]|uniref:DUF4870 domain-containing protein n=1 Tax=Sphingobacterium corticibacterium TaxID=2484746 RepID=A0A4Q6XL68_9SPHI|nr:DUF4870 domain-containing protein [Sphingobacterium corticibacterium]RZF60205.1 DUF4870 domain-containing protein [Sphingobacterium corticibacterium]